MSYAIRTSIEHHRAGASAAELPRFETGPRMLIAGLVERYRSEDCAAASAAQWQRFARYFGRIAGQVGHVAYGARCETDEPGSVDYLCGIEVSDFSSMPRNFGRLCLPAQRYLVFAHRGHAAGDAWLAGWGRRLSELKCELTAGQLFERYPNFFDPQARSRHAELWVPVIGSGASFTAELADASDIHSPGDDAARAV
ncbi:MAG TPA: GyrI-like domain-containing protein [Povalibacter sp.]|nr:GyrI-like domain-containing protein [Povalibacter sp.]